jgi:hypothetical protein
VTAVVGVDEKELDKKLVGGKDFDLEFGTFKLPKQGPAGKKGADPGARVVYQGSRPLASVTLADPNGKEIACRLVTGYQPLAGARQTPYQALIFITTDKLDGCTIRVKYYSGVEEVKVLFDLEVGPGL